jgi:TonB family protein
MSSIFIYAIESSICLTLLWAFSEITLKRDTRHKRNRYFLMASMIFSAVVPLLNIRIEGTGTLVPPGGLVSFLLPEIAVSPSGAAEGTGNFLAALPWLYLAGFILSSAFLIAGSAGLLKLFLSGKHNGKVIVFDSDGCDCFSAFGHVFISGSIRGDEATRMINHELKHIRLGHHTDLFLAGLITAVQWFNPAAYLMKRSLQAVHEYEADNECITEGEDARSYQELLVTSVFRTRTPVFSNTFSTSSLLKKRIIMMTKKRTGSTASLKMILVLPLALALVIMFACKDSSAKKEAAPAVAEMQTPAEVFTVVEVMPVFRNDTTYAELMKWVGENVVYPEEAKTKGIQGKVAVKFIIDEHGNVTAPEVVMSVDPLLDQAALDVISKCPQWSPGLQKGIPVKTYFTLPLAFNLN